MKLRLIAIFTLFLFAAGIFVTAEARGGGGSKGGGRAGSVKSAPRAPAKSAPAKVAPPQGANKAAAGGTAGAKTTGGVASKIKSWFGSRQAGTAMHSSPATPTNNYYYSNGRYNGWSGLFWGYLMGRALAPHSYPATQQPNEYSLSEGQPATAGGYAWEEPTMGENIVAYGVLLLVILLIVLVVRLAYKTIRRRFVRAA